MIQKSDLSALARRYFAAYESKDRPFVEGLLRDDFTFTSPRDDHIDRERYLERCWPNAETTRAIRIRSLMSSGDEVLARYDLETTGGERFHNTELLRFEGGRLRAVEVYFGDDSGPQGEGASEGARGDEAAIRRLLEERARAVLEKDVDGVFAAQADDVVTFDLPPPLVHRGKGAMRESLSEWFASWRGPVRMDLQDLEVAVSGDVAFCHGLERMRGTRTDGQEVDMWLRLTVCLRKRDGRWQAVHEHASVPFYMDGSLKAAVDLKP